MEAGYADKVWLAAAGSLLRLPPLPLLLMYAGSIFGWSGERLFVKIAERYVAGKQ